VRDREHRYDAAAILARQRTEPDSVILSMQHSGSLRYYAGRTTLRYDLLAEEWLDRTIAWLDQHGAHPYLLIEEWEQQIFRDHFGALNAMGRLDFQPVRVVAHAGTRIYLYDLAPGRNRLPPVILERVDVPVGATRPVAPPVLTFRHTAQGR
jgi:hypothetical protein